MGKRPAVFLDRDGVLTVPEFRDGRSYAPKRLEDFRCYPEAAACLGRLRDAGHVLVVVTNQPDVGNGLVPMAVVEAMHERLARELPIARIEVCPHRSADACECRKPRPGMLLRAADALGLELTRSFMVGDRASDVEAGRRAGCRTLFLDRGYTEPRPASPDATVASLSEATEWILAAAERPSKGRPFP